MPAFPRKTLLAAISAGFLWVPASSASALTIDRLEQISSASVQHVRFHHRRMHGHHWRWHPRWNGGRVPGVTRGRSRR